MFAIYSLFLTHLLAVAEDEMLRDLWPRFIGRPLMDDLQVFDAPPWQLVPRTAEEFATTWRRSTQFQALRAEVEAFDELHPLGKAEQSELLLARKLKKSKFL